MASPWERFFAAMARTLAVVVMLAPLAVACILVTAALAGAQRPDPLRFVSSLGAQMLATVAIGSLGAAFGVTAGIGTAFFTRELGAGRIGRAIDMAAVGLSAFPAVVLGWFGATIVLPEVLGRTSASIFFAACIVVTLAVLPRAYALGALALGAITPALREAATAAGASAGRVSAHVLIPAVRAPLRGIYADGLTRAVGEAAGVSIVFLAAARSGYPVSLFTIAGSLVGHAQTMQVTDAGIAQAALVVLLLALAAQRIGARSGGIQWAR